MYNHIMVYLMIFHTTSLHSNPYYLLHSTKTKLYIPGNRPNPLIVFTHVANFTLFSTDEFLVLNNFFMILLDVLLVHMLYFI